MLKRFITIMVCGAIAMNATGCGLFTENKTVAKNEVEITYMGPDHEMNHELDSAFKIK